MTYRPANCCYGKAVMSEENLTGGNITSVTRVDDTIRRPAGFWTPQVHALLDHLARKHIPFTPRPLGIDDQGREILSYLPGHIGTYPDGWPFPDGSVMTRIGEILRQIHDATADFPASDEGWQFQVGAPRSGSVICHNDFAPYNVLFERGAPVGVIDWDFAAPAPPEWDVAHALWRFIPLYPPQDWWMGTIAEFPLSLRAKRFRLLCQGYGITPTATLLDVVEERQRVVFHTVKKLAKDGVPGFVKLWNGAESEDGFEELAYLKEIKNELARYLD